MPRAKTKEEVLEESLLYKKDNEEILDAFRKKNKYGQNPFYLKIKCLKHNHIFEILFTGYKSGKGCCHCGRERTIASRTKSKEKVKEEFSFRLKPNEKLIDVYHKKRNGHNYNEWWAIINCKYHGDFEISQENHKKGQGCPLCGARRRKEKRTLPREQVEQDFIKNLKPNEKLIKVYRKKGHKNCSQWWGTLRCKYHGDFNISKNNHNCCKNGCPKCKASKGEIKIREYLTKQNIDFKEQYKFNKCKYYKPLPFDFYIPSLNIAIEYQGRQHYKPVEVFGGEKAFKKQQKRDNIKREYCKENNIKLLEIPYTEYNNIEKILSEEL